MTTSRSKQNNYDCVMDNVIVLGLLGNWIRIQSISDVSNILNDNVHATVIPQVPPWTMHHPKVCLDLSILAKKDTPSHVYIQKFNEIKDQYSYCIPIYTDGSKDNDRVGCGLIINNLSINPSI